MKRYDLKHYVNTIRMQEKEYGKWVKHSDAEARVKELTDALEKLKDMARRNGIESMEVYEICKKALNNGNKDQ